MTVNLNVSYGAKIIPGTPIPAVILKGMPMGLLLIWTYAIDGG